MFLSKRKNGYWYIFYQNSNQKKTCISTKSKFKREAISFLSNFRVELKQREKNKVIPITISQFRFHFLKYSESVHALKTTQVYVTTFNKLLEYFGDIQISDINKSKIQEYFQNRINRSSIYAARKDLICLSSSFNKAVSEKYLTENPCSGIKRYKIPEKQPLFFTEIDFNILLNVIDNKEIKELVIFAVGTGLRSMEILSLEWDQINLKDRTLILDNRHHITKSKKIRTIPLSVNALQILTGLGKTKISDLVFNIEPNKTNQNKLSTAFKKYVYKSKLNPNLKFHSLRHTFASWLIQRGAPIYEVSKLLGHSDLKTTEIYIHVGSEDMRNSINLISINN